METKFKVGDKVRVKKDLIVGEHYDNGCYFNSDMKEYKGKQLTIKNVGECEGFSRYDVKENRWTFTDSMLEDIFRTIDDLQFGDILTLKNGEKYVFADGTIYGEDCLNDCDCYEVEDYYKDNLTREDDEHKYDITKVEREGQVIYEREEILEVTMKEVCEKFDQEVKIVKENA